MNLQMTSMFYWNWLRSINSIYESTKRKLKGKMSFCGQHVFFCTCPMISFFLSNLNGLEMQLEWRKGKNGMIQYGRLSRSTSMWFDITSN